MGTDRTTRGRYGRPLPTIDICTLVPRVCQHRGYNGE